MKPEELLNSMDHIGEDLLAEAEQNILVRTRRSWFKPAVAAILVAAIGIGSIIALPKLHMRSTTQASNPTAVVENREVLPSLEIGDSWMHLPGKLIPVSNNCPPLYDSSITSLPVYSDRCRIVQFIDASLQEDDGPSYDHPCYYKEEELRLLLEQAVQRVGLRNPDKPIAEQISGDLSGMYVYSEESHAYLEIGGDGKAEYWHDDTEYSDTNEDLLLITGNAFREHATELAQQTSQELGLSGYENLLAASGDDIVYVFPTRDDPKEQLLARSFESYTMILSSQHELYSLSWYQLPNSSALYSTDANWYELLGQYPILSLEEAKATVLEGNYLTEEDTTLNLTEDRLSDVELVYPLQEAHTIMIPYYRFWIHVNSAEQFSVLVPAVRPKYLSDFPETTTTREEDTEPVQPETTEAKPTTREPAESETTALEITDDQLSAIEAELPDEYFSLFYVNDRAFFSDTHTRIWQEDGNILKKDLASGEVETLFSLAPNDEITTTLVGVTDNRLYFGWNNADDWRGVYVYSVDHHGEDKTEIAAEPQEVRCNGGWIYMVSFHTDVRQYTLKAIDRNDKTAVDIKECWASAVIDDALYYIYVPALQDWDKSEMDEAERDALLQHVQYAVCCVDADSSIETLGFIDQEYDSYFQYHTNYPSIDQEQGEIVFYNEEAETITRLDLSTLEPKAKTVWIPGERASLVRDSITLHFAAVPYLDDDTEGAEEINAEISAEYGDLENWSEGDEIWRRVSYEELQYQNIVSIIIRTSDIYGVDYTLYRYDRSSGQRLDTAALLQKVGISQDSFLAECHTRFKEQFEEENAYMDEQTREISGYYDLLAREDEYVNMDLMVYPDKDGQLVVIAPIVNFAGGACHYTPLVLDLK